MVTAALAAAGRAAFRAAESTGPSLGLPPRARTRAKKVAACLTGLSGLRFAADLKIAALQIS